MFASATFFKLTGKQFYRLVGIYVVVISAANLFGGQQVHKQLGTIITQVDAILLPKTRICFNSMSTSFQSECVYCDSRLYASTITACTGQPILANNVTQAQAFCIATACLQVPVFTKSNLINEVITKPAGSAATIKSALLSGLNLFRPSVLFGRRGYNYINNKWLSLQSADSYRAKNLAGFVRSRRSTLISESDDGDDSRYQIFNISSSAEDPQASAYSRFGGGQSERIEVKEFVVPKSSLQTTNETNNSLVDLHTTTSPNNEATNSPTSTTSTQSTPTSIESMTSPPPTPPTTMASEETRSIGFPNFNQMHEQINRLNAAKHSNLRPVFAGPIWPVLSAPQPLRFHAGLSNRRPAQLQVAADQLANLVQSMSDSLAIKKANFARLLQEIGFQASRAIRPRAFANQYQYQPTIPQPLSSAVFQTAHLYEDSRLFAGEQLNTNDRLSELRKLSGDQAE